MRNDESEDDCENHGMRGVEGAGKQEKGPDCELALCAVRGGAIRLTKKHLPYGQQNQDDNAAQDVLRPVKSDGRSYRPFEAKDSVDRYGVDGERLNGGSDSGKVHRLLSHLYPVREERQRRAGIVV